MPKARCTLMPAAHLLETANHPGRAPRSLRQAQLFSLKQ